MNYLTLIVLIMSTAIFVFLFVLKTKQFEEGMTNKFFLDWHMFSSDM